MSFRLKENEAFSDGIQRIVLEQVDKALKNLQPNVRSKDEAIHDARVCVKKIRAVLRLIRDSLGDKIYDEEDTAYRNVARLLSKVRDSTAMLEILDKLTQHYSDQLSRDAFDGVRSALRSSKLAQRQNAKTAMSKAARSLRRARTRIEGWAKPTATTSLEFGLRRIYKSGRKSFKLAYDEGSVESFHEWRKHVKHLLYQTRVLKLLWGRMMKALTAELDTLGELLSEHHDLSILRDKVTNELSDTVDGVEAETLVALIIQRRKELEVQAQNLGARIYADKPNAFAARSARYWETLGRESKTDAIVQPDS
jgi:CHAD domain-containing protein